MNDDNNNDNKPFVDMLSEIFEGHSNKEFLITIAQKGSDALQGQFEQFQVVKDGLGHLFSISA